MKTYNIAIKVDFLMHNGIVGWCLDNFGDWGHLDSDKCRWSLTTQLRGGNKFDCLFQFKRKDDETLFKLTWL